MVCFTIYSEPEIIVELSYPACFKLHSILSAAMLNRKPFLKQIEEALVQRIDYSLSQIYSLLSMLLKEKCESKS